MNWHTSNVLSSLNQTLHDLFEETDEVLLIGEDLRDPYGGAFKVSKGLSTAYPDRVITTPIAEAGFVGVSAGMAMRGLRPIVEIMFGDFLALAADQLLNHITKYRWMYNDKVRVPLVIRAPMGGRRGYGPTHSQSIEKHLIGMPGLLVVAPSVFHDPGGLLRKSFELDDPVVFIENKLMYARPLRRIVEGRHADLFVRSSSHRFETQTLSYAPFDEADVTVVTYGGMAELAVEAAEELLIEDEIVAEVIVASSLNPIDLDPIADSVHRSGALITFEEGTGTLGWGTEVIAQVAEADFNSLKVRPIRVAARDLPIANTRVLEEAILPQKTDLVEAIRSVVGRRPVFKHSNV